MSVVISNKKQQAPTMTNGNHDTKASHSDERADGLERPSRDDSPFATNVFPETELGKLLDGIILTNLIKQEPRQGWSRKRACSESVLSKHPCEMVAAHQWGVSWLISCLVHSKLFRQEMLPNFDTLIAIQMGLIHDVPECITGDITPVDGISAEEKHRRESKAIGSILLRFPNEVAAHLQSAYERYEERKCVESKFVKDCDKLDFLITAFMLERQGFRGFSEFYGNSNKGFHTKLAQDLANQLIETRNQLAVNDQLYPK